MNRTLGMKLAVALLSIGSEEVKGNQLVKQVHEILKQDASINFVGNVEGRDLFAGGCEDLDWTMSVLFDAMGAMSL